MFCHLRRRPTQRSSATPICPTGGDGTGRFLCHSSSTMARHGVRRRFASRTLRGLDPSRSSQTLPYLCASALSLSCLLAHEHSLPALEVARKAALKRAGVQALEPRLIWSTQARASLCLDRCRS